MALVGPPNSGKTTLFNALTGVGGHPVNYPGATVEYTVGAARRSLAVDLRMADTPGVYSLTPKSVDEQLTLDVLFATDRERPAACLLVADATQLSRHLPLVRQVAESGFPVVLAITMKDLHEKDGWSVDTAELGRLLGVPVVTVHAKNGEGISALVQALQTAAQKPHTAVVPAPWSTARQEAERKWSGDILERVRRPMGPQPLKTLAERTRAIDRVLLHPVAGVVCFAAIMALLFTGIFWLAAPAMDWISNGFDGLAAWVLEHWGSTLWADFLANGLILSLGAILTFVPQIAILFLAITLLEDTGYLARAATLVDRPMAKLGLNGRSFVPLLSGYACAIPAMLAARTIPNRRERWITLWIIPLMSCSARLPVYSLLLAFLFWGEPAWKPGVALAALYFASLVVGAVVAAVVNRFLPREAGSFFVLELPYYRRPNALGVFNQVVARTKSYLQKAGPAIFVFAVGLWAAMTFPHYDAATPSEKLRESYAAHVGQVLDPVMAPMGGDWRTGVALVSAFAAREVFVGSLGLVLQTSEKDTDQDFPSLLESMRTATLSDGSALFTPASTVGLMLFFLIALQCMATVAVASREFGGWRYPLLQLVGFNLFAYAVAVAAVQGLRLWGWA
ncbi:ferrous iron transporter B [bacterium]|nr:ferrous iron transporter B [bacterium]